VGDFRRLLVYQRAIALGDDLHREVVAWDSFDRWTTGTQLVRAADSVAANIAEAFGRQADRDERRFLWIARGSALETEHWVERALARELLTDMALPERAREVSRLLNGLINRHLTTDD
jgi:four helix bundle protein